MTTSKRLAPGKSTAIVLYIAAAALAVTTFVLAVCKGVLISGEVHFGIALLSLFGSVAAMMMAAAAEDGLFAWPAGSAVDPPPYKLLPYIQWERGSNALSRNYYIITLGFVFVSVGMMIAVAKTPQSVLLSPEFHFFASAVSVLAAPFFILRGAAVEDRPSGNSANRSIALAVTSVWLLVMSIITALTAAKGIVLFSPEFHLGVCLLTLALSGVALYRCGRAADGTETKRKHTTNCLLIVAVGLAVTAIIAALVAANGIVLLFPAFHLGLCMLTLALACVTVYGAGSVADGTKAPAGETSAALFIIAVVLVIAAVVVALIATKTVLFSAGFHLTLVGVILLLAGGTAVFGALLQDRGSD